MFLFMGKNLRLHFIFRLKEGSSAEEALEQLTPFLEDIYEIQDSETGELRFGGYSDEEIPLQSLTHVILEERGPVDEIDWQKQWAEFAPHFHDGLAHVDLAPYGGPTLLMQPGAGFGDLSHATTRLTLALMAPIVKEKIVFDIGCGSGILAIAALLLGAERAYGIDIDAEALKHSLENAHLNQVEDRAFFSKKIDPSVVPNAPFVIVMNMIESDQKNAWNSVHALHSKNCLVVISGILTARRDPYLKLATSWGWNLKGEKEEEGWSAFVFTQNEN